MEGRINIIDIIHQSTGFCMLQLNLPVEHLELVSTLSSQVVVVVQQLLMLKL